jgi:uncharacterized protein (DUF111 family)
MHGYESDLVVRLETNLDDCPPELLGAVMERLLAVGALDVWFTPIQMKKNRPGVMLSVLGTEELEGTLAEVIFTETSAFGLRREKVLRLKLGRRFEEVETIYGKVTVKIGLKGGKVVQVAPEFESCRTVAQQAGVPIREVFNAAQAGWRG